MLKVINGVLLLYVILITILALNSTIVFGHGSGDLAYVISLIVITMILLILFVLSLKYRNQLQKLTLPCLLMIVAGFYTWKFTTGRGSEYPWKRNIFYEHHESSNRENQITASAIYGRWYLNQWTTYRILDFGDSTVFVDNNIDNNKSQV